MIITQGVGQWWLEYTSFDNMENHCPEHTSKKRLITAIDEASALSEARQVWAELSAKPYKGWGDQTKTYPREPRVVYVVELEAKGGG